jgi:hypothetical protein
MNDRVFICRITIAGHAKILLQARPADKWDSQQAFQAPAAGSSV